MIGNDQELRGVGERLVQRIPAGVGVAMRAEDRQAGYGRVKLARQRPNPRFSGKQHIGIDKPTHAPDFPPNLFLYG